MGKTVCRSVEGRVERARLGLRPTHRISLEIDSISAPRTALSYQEDLSYHRSHVIAWDRALRGADYVAGAVLDPLISPALQTSNGSSLHSISLGIQAVDSRGSKKVEEATTRSTLSSQCCSDAVVSGKQ